MAEIFDFAERLAARCRSDEDQKTIDEFLLSEGLDLLAAYRSIPNPDLRQRLKLLIE